EARTNSFVLSAATVMVGPVASLFDLTPASNSLGLVKDVVISSTPTFADLTQGAKGTIVASVKTANPVKASFTVYEYTSQNLAYGLGLDGYSLTAPQAGWTLSTAMTGNTATPATTVTFTSPTDVSPSLVAGTWVMLQGVDSTMDHVHYAQLASNATVSGTGSYTITLTLVQGLKTGNNFAIGDRIAQVNAIDVGSLADEPLYGAKIVATLPGASEPLSILFPKVKIIRGFSMSFSTEKFTDLPFEFQPYQVVSTDPFYSIFQGRVARMFTTN
ncbi:MAG TPA: hypothetical protein PLD10_18535, partial [Rhodopila sp.]|nr:hypothetical protein [Rhodopila sp.]